MGRPHQSVGLGLTPREFGYLAAPSTARPRCGIARPARPRLDTRPGALWRPSRRGVGVDRRTSGRYGRDHDCHGKLTTAGQPRGGGGGQPIEFYRVVLSAGDQIDINYDMLSQPNCGYLYLFAPTVSDFNLAEAVSFGTLPGHLSSPRRRLRLQAYVRSPAGTRLGLANRAGNQPRGRRALMW